MGQPVSERRQDSLCKGRVVEDELALPGFLPSSPVSCHIIYVVLGWNSGPCACWASPLPTKLRSQAKKWMLF